jgi:hypothetical protein
VKIERQEERIDNTMARMAHEFSERNANIEDGLAG